MFGRLPFASSTFSDLTVYIGFVYYSPVRMETRVTLVSPSGQIITTVPSKKIKTGVDSSDSSVPSLPFISIPGIKLKTKISIVSPVSGYIVVSPSIYKIKTNVTNHNTQNVQNATTVPSFKIKTQVTIASKEVVTLTDLNKKLKTDVN